MLDIIMRAGCFVSIILLGYILKGIGFFKQEDFTLLSKITIRITLAAAIIVSFSARQIDPALLSLPLLGLGGGLLYILLGFLVFRKTGKEQQAFAVLNLPGYNIGTFVLPFAQGFLGPIGVMATSLFDTGNAVICLGGAYSVASMVKDGCGFSVRRIVKALSRSVPFVCYVLMLTMNLLHIPIPKFVVSTAEIIASANAFMAMLMIGVGFQLKGERSQIFTIVKILSLRYGLAAILASVFYFLLPFELDIRRALVILAFSPIGSAVPGFTNELKGDVGLSSAINSISILISIVITVTALTVML